VFDVRRLLFAPDHCDAGRNIFARRVHLTAEAQAFNMLNRANFNLPDAFADQPLTFGKIFSAQPPRQIQFALLIARRLRLPGTISRQIWVGGGEAFCSSCISDRSK
jgi:hypothetical protein